MDPRSLSIKDYTYDLPPGKIARHPLANREDARLLVWHENIIREDRYYNLPSYLPEGALLVFNNTKVIAARVLFQKESGGVVEIFVLEPHDQYEDINAAITQKGKVLWKCLIGGASKWKHGLVLHKEVKSGSDIFRLNVAIKERLADSFIIEFSWTPGNSPFSEILDFFGVLPIPPYLKRDTDDSDILRYQTTYADIAGSVAAPTAGLHFTPSLFQSLGNRAIDAAFITLHVGAGTFMPVKALTLDAHIMHAEYIDVDAGLIRKICNQQQNIFAVGTTSLRTLESLYWMGLKCFLDPGISVEALEISQWEAYHLEGDAINKYTALNALLEWMTNNKLHRLICKTRILIAPGYKAKVIRGLITNFHQPDSTLLLLVAALIGEEWRNIYRYALEKDFRFLSYGDGCLLYLPPA